MPIAGGANPSSRPADIAVPSLDYCLLFAVGPRPAWVRLVGSGRFVDVNQAALEHYGYSRDEFLAMQIGDIYKGELTEPAGPSGRRLHRHRTKDGASIVVRVDMTDMTLAGGAARLEVLDDVTAQLEVDAARRDSDAQFREAQALAHVGSWRWDIPSNGITWSPELCRIFGVRPNEGPRTLADYIARVHPDDRELATDNVQHALETLEPYDSVYRCVVADGSTRWLHTRGRVVADDDGQPIRAIGICQDITEQKLAEEDLTRQALHDALTGLPERTLFVDRLETSIRRLGRQNTALAVLFLDLDRFKAVNDRLGHAVGDDVLRSCATRLSRVLRPGDTIARFGGDEFAILCEDLTPEAVNEVATRVVGVLGEALVIDGRTVTISVSVGVALTFDAAASAEALLHDADLAMYEAKERGRGRFVVYDHASRARGLARLRRSEEVRRAVANGELRVFFQPDINLRDDMAVGVEALVRWQHPKLGLVGPEQFIAVAEETGSVVALGAWVLAQACREVASWPVGPGQRPLDVAVNISACQLSEPSLIESVRRALDDSGLAPARLCLEITESVLMDDVDAAVAALLELKTLGVRLAIDDFGTGYSSLSYLRRFPVDVVKIDRAFIAGVGIDPAADAIVAAVINLSHALGLSVVAEGIETEDQLVAIRALGCDRGQGFFWSASLPTEDLGDWKVQHQRPPRVSEPVPIHALLAERTEALRAATGRSVLLEAKPKLGSVATERRALRTIIDHLLSNAVTYSPSEHPVVVTGASDRHWVRISVADFGVGMTSDEATRCFEQFWQADVMTDASRGTGMGLYIVRSLVEAMGGHIGVKSAKGKGSTFTVALPSPARAKNKGRAAATPAAAARLGEDSSIREFMRQIGVPNRKGA